MRYYTSVSSSSALVDATDLHAHARVADTDTR